MHETSSIEPSWHVYMEQRHLACWTLSLGCRFRSRFETLHKCVSILTAFWKLFVGCRIIRNMFTEAHRRENMFDLERWDSARVSEAKRPPSARLFNFCRGWVLRTVEMRILKSYRGIQEHRRWLHLKWLWIPWMFCYLREAIRIQWRLCQGGPVLVQICLHGGVVGKLCRALPASVIFFPSSHLNKLSLWVDESVGQGTHHLRAMDGMGVWDWSKNKLPKSHQFFVWKIFAGNHPSLFLQKFLWPFNLEHFGDVVKVFKFFTLEAWWQSMVAIRQVRRKALPRFFFSGCHWPESLWGFKSCPIDPELLCQFPGVASWTKHGRLGFGVGLDEVVMKDNFFFT